jgi:serine/threonine-protein kinase
LERAIERFESAWQQGHWPIMENYLPPANPERRAALIELVHTDLECRLKAGATVRVEGYLARYPELAEERSVVLDLITAEFALRCRRESGLAVEVYARRFPAYAEDLFLRLQPSSRSVLEPGRPILLGSQFGAETPPPVPVHSIAGLVEAIDVYRLLPPEQRAELTGIQGAFSEPQALARDLLQRGWLTPLQINRLFQGRAGELVLGPYCLLERLGAGGMGQVFKARSEDLDSPVAVKLLRKDLVRYPLAVRRFRREIRAIAKLAHPNVVLALDIGQVEGTYFFVMEYIEGIDLARLLKQFGPPGIPRACEYIRQAALGLQHAHERGLVHRDIKPSNLIVRPADGTVKLLDLGLARLILPPEEGDQSSTLTREGTVVGTPDYMAPEQTLNAHAADIRSDIYSLGCTLYQLVTGKLPFPGKNLAEKLLNQQVQEPRPVRQLRPETPTEVAAILHHMMAKQADERFQTPAEVATALAPWSARQ